MAFNNMPKFGLSWANKNSFDINNFINRNVGWYYSWDATPGWKNATTDITFCPMLWGAKNAQDFNRRVTQDPNGKYNQGKCVLGINEPNQRGQADMSPLEACSLMAQYVVPLKMHGFHIVSPATTSAPSGTDWMDEFRTTCPGVWSAIDSVALHFYDTSTTKFKKYVNDWHDRYGKPIWVTEYACQNFNGGAQCSTQKTVDFHLEMGNWFEQQDFVQAYAPFGVMREMQGVSAPNRLIQNDQPNLLFNALTS
ncbi:hypothetical protein MVES1_002781 [Malassezia vespertilionis]|uniref:uncharacterized protein n=1 Tax=Malassezia vespertilionis TaxID=2020962 RepID=UPI0024B06ECD|nr:uncharacterized protein MVES1_002781 [Malassezia vespertilionis]WFD07417.1 hypothetical protein MVES1_002781 [Malassezia vespertilionis]